MISLLISLIRSLCGSKNDPNRPRPRDLLKSAVEQAGRSVQFVLAIAVIALYMPCLLQQETKVEKDPGAAQSNHGDARWVCATPPIPIKETNQLTMPSSPFFSKQLFILALAAISAGATAGYLALPLVAGPTRARTRLHPPAAVFDSSIAIIWAVALGLFADEFLSSGGGSSSSSSSKDEDKGMADGLRTTMQNAVWVDLAVLVTWTVSAAVMVMRAVRWWRARKAAKVAGMVEGEEVVGVKGVEVGGV